MLERLFPPREYTQKSRVAFCLKNRRRGIPHYPRQRNLGAHCWAELQENTITFGHPLMKLYIVALAELLRPLEAEIHNRASHINLPSEGSYFGRVRATCQHIIR